MAYQKGLRQDTGQGRCSHWRAFIDVFLKLTICNNIAKIHLVVTSNDGYLLFLSNFS